MRRLLSARVRFLVCGASFVAAALTAACVRQQGATDLADPGLPFGPSSLDVRPLAYVQDIKPILDADCSSCHSAREREGGYSVASYADVLDGQRTGDAQSSLVVTSAPGGSMYRYFGRDPTARAALVFRWMVVYDAAERR
jgi:hypothetical protein